MLFYVRFAQAFSFWKCFNALPDRKWQPQRPLRPLVEMVGSTRFITGVAHGLHKNPIW